MKNITSFRGTLLALAMIWLTGLTASAQQSVSVSPDIVAYPDIIVHNGKIVTMDDASFGLNKPIGTIAEAMAIRDGRIQLIGPNARVLAMAGPRTEKYDLKGRMVFPGIVDTHTHIHNNELNQWLNEHPETVREISSTLNVAGKTDDELTRATTLAVQEYVKGAPVGRWAFVGVGGGGGAGTSAGVGFLAQKKYTKAMLDKIAPNHPIMLTAHPSYVINTAGIEGIKKLYGSNFSLDAAGIDGDGRVRGTAPQYGRGLVIDYYFNTRVPQLADIVEQGLAKNAAVGITTFVSHLMGQRFLDAFNHLARADRMPIRFAYTHWYGLAAGYPDPENFYRRMGDMQGMGTPYFWQAGVGLGSIDSGPPRFCSSMEAPKAIKDMEFCQNAEGSPMYKATKTAIANYQRVNVGHAYADKGVDYVMDAVEAAMKENPAITLDYIKSRRLTTDHCGFYPSIEQLPRMGKLGFYISCGGNVLSRSFFWIGDTKYPKIYTKRIAPIRSAIENGVVPSVENEAGVVGLTSRTYMFGAVPFMTRRNEMGNDVSPEEAVDRNTLLKMMTSWPARFVMKEKELGTLENGKYADFLVMNGDLTTAPVEQMANIFPVMSVVGGKVRVLRKEFADELGRPPVGPQLNFDNKSRYVDGE